jgi:hypothetical protein
LSKRQRDDNGKKVHAAHSQVLKWQIGLDVDPPSDEDATMVYPDHKSTEGRWDPIASIAPRHFGIYNAADAHLFFT